MTFQSGRHFLQIPGPTNVPDRVLRALSRPTIDHRGPEFAKASLAVLEGLKRIFQTSGSVVIYPSSGTGAWEAALVNTLSAGDKVLMFETGHFATLWRNMATALGLEVDFVPTDWRHGVEHLRRGIRSDRFRCLQAGQHRADCFEAHKLERTGDSNDSARGRFGESGGERERRRVLRGERGVQLRGCRDRGEHRAGRGRGGRRRDSDGVRCRVRE